MTDQPTMADTIRAIHTQYPDSAHCQHDGEPWPCPTITATEAAPTAPPAAACPECGGAGACNGGPCPLLARHERYVAAILDALARDTSRGPTWGAAAAAVMAVADAEQAALRAEVEQWRATFGRDALPGALRRLEIAEAEVERLRADRVAVLREAANRVDNEELPQDYVDMFDNGARWAARLLRRLADEAQQPETEAPVTVAYCDTTKPGRLYCREHGKDVSGLTPLVSDDLPDGAICTLAACGRDVLAAPAPTEEPTR